MSDDDNLDAHDEGEGIKNLRKQYETTAKELAEAKKAIAEFNASKRQETVASILQAKGVPASAAKLYTGEDASEDAVGKWLEDYKDVFTPGTASAVDENAQAAARVNANSYGDTAREDVQNAGNQILGDPEEIMRAVKTLPYEELVKQGYLPGKSIWG